MTFTTSASASSGITSWRWRARPSSSINSGDSRAVDHAAIETDLSALGRFLITKKEADIAAFKTPNLRNVLVTGPYFHDGSQETLWDVIDHYNKGDGLHNPYLDEDIQPLALTETRYRRPGGFSRIADERGLQETGGQGASAPASALADAAPPARHGEGLRTETCPAEAACPLKCPGSEVMNASRSVSQRGQWTELTDLDSNLAATDDWAASQ